MIARGPIYRWHAGIPRRDCACAVVAIPRAAEGEPAMVRFLLAALLVLAAGLVGSAHAAAAPVAAPSLAGKAFNITVFTDKDKILDKLTFAAKDLTAPMIGFNKAAYTITAGDAKHKKDINFTAQVSDGNGGTLKIAGTVSGNEVNGTIERIPKKGDAKTLQFSGGAAGGAKK
jgi:hypothetical protein